jgi:hypothetical protein
MQHLIFSWSSTETRSSPIIWKNVSSVHTNKMFRHWYGILVHSNCPYCTNDGKIIASHVMKNRATSYICILLI